MNTFSKFNLSHGIQRVLEEKKFLEPTPIQEKVIPQILESTQDLIALAQTGTGKTAAFSLPILTKMDARERGVQTVILSPTRELAMQIAEDIKDFSKYMSDIHVVAVYGGFPIQHQIRDIKRGAQIVVGTPGRMLDLLKRKVLKLENVRWAILDEADEMLNMGFLEDITSILSATPKEKQTLLFSATMSKTIEKIAKRYMNSSMRIEVKATPTTQLAITHQFMMVPARDKLDAFRRYRELHPEMYGIVFCRTKRETQEIGDKLLRDGYPTGVLHGDIEQRHRTRIMDAFKRKETSLLVATDVAARGIDVEKLTHVIHVGVPEQVESYTHRSGRTGRANEKGISMVLAHLREHHALKRIEKTKGITFEEVQVPKREDMIQSDIEKYVKRIDAKTEASPLAKKYVDEMLKNISKEDMEKVARKALLLAVEDRINKFPGENVNRSKAKSKAKGRMKTLVISHGRKSNLTVPHLFGMINEVTKGERVDVGQIQIGDKEASFEVPSECVGQLCSAMSERRFRGKSVHVREGSEVKRTAESWKPKRRRKSSRY